MTLNVWKFSSVETVGLRTVLKVVINKALDCIMEWRSLSIPQFSHILSLSILMNKTNMR